MALFTFRLPDIGEGISEAEIVGWHVKVGDRVEEDQPIADMMTDKATVEMESPVAGVVKRRAGRADRNRRDAGGDRGRGGRGGCFRGGGSDAFAGGDRGRDGGGTRGGGRVS